VRRDIFLIIVGSLSGTIIGLLILSTFPGTTEGILAVLLGGASSLTGIVVALYVGKRTKS
jgi:hypothetical protein